MDDDTDDTLDILDLACRFLNGASAIAAFWAFHSTDAINGHFVAYAFSMFAFTHEALYTNRNNNLSGVNSLLGTFTLFSNPYTPTVHAFNFACSAVRKLGENIEGNFDEVREVRYFI